MTQTMPTQYVSRLAFLRERCRDRRVFHLGCSSGQFLEDRLHRRSLLHAILSEEAQELYGLDLDAKSLETMRSMGYQHLYHGNAEQLDDLPMEETFDVVLAGDLLEHITRPGAMLDGVKRFMKPTGQFIVSTNNAFGFHYQLRRWTGRYAEHPEHVSFFSPETLAHLFERHGYQVLAMYGAFTEPPHGWQQQLKFAIGSPLFRLAPVLSGTLIVVAAPFVNKAA
jgi:2-polyprenyl-3-methyl-5-hydroxy-6-metoxy-1,4-benzoquinol methylase